ncbi:MAG: hypothetical protein AAGC53_03875 [Actinomycetota bacterium]
MAAGNDDGTRIPIPQVAVRGEQPTVLADLESIKQDLLFACQLATRLLAANPDEDDPILIDAMWRASSIAYRRCFTSGRPLAANTRQGRTRVPDGWLESLDERLAAGHQALLNNADKHVAHRVGDEEQASVLLFLEPTGPKGVAGHGVFYLKQMLPTELPPLLIELSTTLLGSIQRAQDRVGSKIVDEANRLSQEEIDDLYRHAAGRRAE